MRIEGQNGIGMEEAYDRLESETCCFLELLSRNAKIYNKCLSYFGQPSKTVSVVSKIVSPKINLSTKSY